MKNLRLAVAAVISVVVTAMVAGPAHGYPDSPNITISLPSSQLYGGDAFTFTVRSDVECAWTVSYIDGRAAGTPATQTGQGRTFAGTFTTKAVEAVFRSRITATCVYTDEAAGVADQSASTSATVTLLPRGAADGGDGDSDAGVGNGNESDTQDDGGEVANENVADTRNGALPDTGGSNQWVLVLGGLLVVVGGGAVVAARRRHGSR